MYQAPTYTAEGEEAEARELPDSLFDGVVNEPVMWQTVKAYLANQRQASASTKNRATIRGGSRKPWRQKGTGRSRQGSIRAPQWQGGAVVFGPTPKRNYSEDVPKKVKWLARRSAYNARAKDGAVAVVEPLELEQPKTRRIADLIDAVGADEGNTLILTDGHKRLVYLSARNIPGVQVAPFGEESCYDVLWADTVIIESAALDRCGEVAHA